MHRTWISYSRKRRMKTMINILVFPKVPQDPIVIMTLESFSSEPEKYISVMPNPPIYSHPEMKKLMEAFFEDNIPSGYEKRVELYEKDDESKIIATVILPSFNYQEARTLGYRINKFIEGELQLIKDGY